METYKAVYKGHILYDSTYDNRGVDMENKLMAAELPVRAGMVCVAVRGT